MTNVVSYMTGDLFCLKQGYHHSTASRSYVSCHCSSATCKTSHAVIIPPPDLMLTTDASLTGWGAHLDNCQASGLWSEEEQLLHINCLELKAILYAVQAFLPKFPGHQVVILSDNTMAVIYVNRQEGMVLRSLCKLAIEIWDLCITNNCL